MTKIHVLTLFPEMIVQGLTPSVIGRAIEKDIISLNAVNIRNYTLDRHGKVDDYPYGGGAGMLIQAQPVYDAHRAVTGGRAVRTIYVTPQGTPFTQKIAGELAEEEELVFLCGHYEGIDERVLEKIVTDYISIGDYVLTGGELPAMVMIDAIGRLIPGVLGNDTSAEEESFYNGLLEYPHYSRPEVWQGESVPEVLLSGDHSRVAAWRLEQSRQRTAERRPDLYEKYRERQRIIQILSREKRNNIHMMESLAGNRCEVLYAEGEDILLYDRECKSCMLTAERQETGEKLAGMVPEDAGALLISQSFMRDIFVRKQYRVSWECMQVLYTQRQTLPVRLKNIRQLSADDFEKVCNCRLFENDEILSVRERLLAGALYGAFAEEELTGFMGVHRTGDMGMLFVRESWRRQGIAEALTAYTVNRMLEKGRTPYGYVRAGEEAADRLLQKLGFYKAKKSFWRLEKVLANDT